MKTADAVKNVAEILKRYPGENIAIVVSAMGKTTNAMEVIVDHYFHKRKKELKQAVQERLNYHLEIINALFPDPEHSFQADEEQTDRIPRDR